MKVISHRGNLNGKNAKKENSLECVNEAIQSGFDVEIDVWFTKNNWYLGHDKPAYKIEESFLQSENIWCHAKNLEALRLMLRNSKIHCFWHQKDDYTITSKGYIWTYPLKTTTNNSVIVLKDKKSMIPKNCFGICTDYPMLYV